MDRILHYMIVIVVLSLNGFSYETITNHVMIVAGLLGFDFPRLNALNVTVRLEFYDHFDLFT